jgi:hypothetical protein
LKQVTQRGAGYGVGRKGREEMVLENRAPKFKTTPTSSSLPSTSQISHMFLRNVT